MGSLFYFVYMIDFTQIDYLKNGNARQQAAYKAIQESKVIEKLKAYAPILTGTIPIEIDLPDSDLDIICHCEDHAVFRSDVIRAFGHHQDFKLSKAVYQGMESTIAAFYFNGFEFELFAQNIPTQEQRAYQHMLVEYRLLQEHGPAFKQQIIALKQSGMKTEPAFAKLLGLEGNPYLALLDL